MISGAVARTYKRDSRGRFAGGGGSSGGRPKAKAAPRGKNRLTRDNAGRITSVGGDGATARGGRLKTAAGGLRAKQTARIAGGSRLKGGKGGGRKGPGVTTASVERRLARVAAASGKKKTGAKAQRSASIRRTASVIYRGQQSLAKSGDLSRETVRRGTPKMAQQAAVRAATAPQRRKQRLVPRMDGEAFGARMKRARGASLRRGINESDRDNALTGAQRRATAPSKRFAASNQRQARAERTAAAAQAFYRNYGSASAFGSRTRQSTATSPNFGSKRRTRRR